MTDPALPLLQKIRDDLLAEHHKRHAEFSRLTLALAFASLFFLLELEQAYPKDSRSTPCMLSSAWAAAFCATVFGAGYLVLEMTLPLRSLGNVHIKYVEGSQDKAIDKIYWHWPKQRLANALYWIHIVSLLLLAISGALFKFGN